MKEALKFEYFKFCTSWCAHIARLFLDNYMSLFNILMEQSSRFRHMQVDICYNLGLPGIRGFISLAQHFKEANWLALQVLDQMIGYNVSDVRQKLKKYSLYTDFILRLGFVWYMMGS